MARKEFGNVPILVNSPVTLVLVRHALTWDRRRFVSAASTNPPDVVLIPTTKQAGVAVKSVATLCCVESILVQTLVTKVYVEHAKFASMRVAIADRSRRPSCVLIEGMNRSARRNMSQMMDSTSLKNGQAYSNALIHATEHSTAMFTAARNHVMLSQPSLATALGRQMLSRTAHAAKRNFRRYQKPLDLLVRIPSQIAANLV